MTRRTPHDRLVAIAVLIFGSLSGAILPGVFAAAADVDFSRDIRPILSDHCFACHGPDEHERATGLRLDTGEGLAEVVDTSDVDASEIVLRIDSSDADEVMPPPAFNKALTREQKDKLRLWITAGANFESHWAFSPPRVSESSADVDARPGQPIDGFIDGAIIEAGLAINPPADRRTLLRRVCLDLTGLPPTREQIDTFLSDKSPDAFSTLVDELLRSRHFGQHVGRYWLDLVRYADTHGLHLDNYREMWPYRDWVIDAFNDNMPFDQFITHQLAGDLLPDATDNSRIASGFNRLNVTTSEGGSIYDEVFARNCMDRTDAFGTVFLGLTTGCAVCHDHKFDPISQRDYYSLLSFFNSLDGKALDNNVKDPAPVIAVPSEDQSAKIAALDQTLASLAAEKAGPNESVDAAQAAWETSLIDPAATRFQALHPSAVASEAGVTLKTPDDGTIEVDGPPMAKDDITIVASLPAEVQWQTLRLEALVDEAHPKVGLGSNGNAVLSEITVESTDATTPEQWIEVPIVYAFADYEQAGDEFSVANAIDGKTDAAKGWAVGGHEKDGPRTAWFVIPSLVASGDDAKIRVRLKFQSKYAAHQFHRMRLTLSNGSPSVPEDQRIKLGPIHTSGPFAVENPAAAFYREFASEKNAFNADETFRNEGRDYRWQSRSDFPEVDVNVVPTLPELPSTVMWHQTIHSPRDQSITMMLGADDGYVVYVGSTEVGRREGVNRIEPLALDYQLPLKKGDNDIYLKFVNYERGSEMTYAYRSPAIEVPSRLRELVKTPTDAREESIAKSLRRFFREVHCLHPDWLALVDQEKGTRIAREKLQSEIPTTLVWKELEKPRQAHVLTRGQYDQLGEAVPRSTPSFLPPFQDDQPKNRLGLARWLTSPEHPLTARVAVNRFWQQLFGIGLVKTSEDFGSQGEPPSHPELLDWLATDFQANGWDVKRLLKNLVMSNAYQRSSKVGGGMLAIDPSNRLLARGPRHRLDAEVLRDQALSLSGQLNDSEGGPSVKPPQPAGLWEAVGYSGSNTVKFVADTGDKIHRRSVYTFWKRTSAPPQMSTLDAPSRESCTARRERTNTPLQALLLMNETQYVEAAKLLARRAMEVPSVETDSQRLEWIFETVTARLPNNEELIELSTLIEDLAVYYDQHPDLAAKLVETSDARAAAWTVLASTLLNMDETVTK